MTEQNFTLLRVWVEGERKALEWSVGGRTFQILGLKGGEGCYERFFNRGKHPTRRRVGDKEATAALQDATSPLVLYRRDRNAGREFENAEAALEAARQWLGAK